MGVTGTRGAVLDVLAGILACYRGDLSAAQQAAQAAQSRLPDREDRVWPAIRGWVRWLHAEIGAARDDSNEVRDQVSPLWEIPGLEIASDIMWRPLLVAARLEADLACHTLGRRGGGRPSTPSLAGEQHIERMRKVAARLHQSGDLGVSWMAQFDAECGRFAGAIGPRPLDQGRRAVGARRAGARPGLGTAARRRVPRRRWRQASGSRRATPGRPDRGGVGSATPRCGHH